MDRVTTVKAVSSAVGAVAGLTLVSQHPVQVGVVALAFVVATNAEKVVNMVRK